MNPHGVVLTSIPPADSDLEDDLTTFGAHSADDDLIISDVRPAAEEPVRTDVAEDVIMNDGTALEQKKNPVAKAARKRRTPSSRTGPSDRCSHSIKKPKKKKKKSEKWGKKKLKKPQKKLEKWGDFSTGWEDVEETLTTNSPFGELVAGVDGFVQMLEEDQDFELWKDPLLGCWDRLKNAVGDSDGGPLLLWLDGILSSVFNT